MTKSDEDYDYLFKIVLSGMYIEYVKGTLGLESLISLQDLLRTLLTQTLKQLLELNLLLEVSLYQGKLLRHKYGTQQDK